jgi:hypothetical protein
LVNARFHFHKFHEEELLLHSPPPQLQRLPVIQGKMRRLKELQTPRVTLTFFL